MGPGFPAKDFTDSLSPNAEFLGKLALRFSGRTAEPNVKHLLFCELGLTVAASPDIAPLAKDVRAVPLIVAGSDYFKVLDPIVSGDAIDMIHLHIFRYGADEGLNNEAVDEKPFPHPTLEKLRAKMSAALNLRLDPLSAARDYARHIAKIANAVKILVPNYGTPLFGGRMVLHRCALLWRACVASTLLQQRGAFLIIQPNCQNAKIEGA